MKYEVTNNNITKTMSFEGVKTMLQSWNAEWTKENIERLWQIELGETTFIMGKEIKRVK